MASRNVTGETKAYFSPHITWINPASAVASCPCVPNGLVRLIACLYDPSNKNRASGIVAERHCSVEFM